MKSVTKKFPDHKPGLKEEFFCPDSTEYKRLWHVEKLFGDGLDLVVNRTNGRCQRLLRKSKSAKWKGKPLEVGPRLYTFLAV